MDSQKFAWLPTKVRSWRQNQSKVIVWLQYYKVTQMSKFTALGSSSNIGEKYCTYIGPFSRELY